MCLLSFTVRTSNGLQLIALTFSLHGLADDGLSKQQPLLTPAAELPFYTCWYLAIRFIRLFFADVLSNWDFCHYPKTVEEKRVLYVVFKPVLLTSIHCTYRLFTYNLICPLGRFVQQLMDKKKKKYTFVFQIVLVFQTWKVGLRTGQSQKKGNGKTDGKMAKSKHEIDAAGQLISWPIRLNNSYICIFI